MAITFPRSLPTVTGIKSISWRTTNATARSMSPFTFKDTVFNYGGSMREVDITLPPMKRSSADVWISFLLSLRGQKDTFLLGDPDAKTLRGNTTSLTVSGDKGDVTVDGTMPTGKTLKTGDYFQIGSGSSARLYRVLEDYTGTGSAEDIIIYPPLRFDASSASAVLSNTVGLFRLSSNQMEWSTNEVSNYGLSFSAVEVV
jgi:hypothetical protein